jgi:integrase
VRPSDVLPSRKKQNYARVSAQELPDLLRKIEVYQGAMTFVRTSELIGARWEEFDLDAGRWDIPAERMKMKTPHIVPLSKQAVTLLRALHTSTGAKAVLFPGERDPKKPMSNNTILKALERMGYKGPDDWARLSRHRVYASARAGVRPFPHRTTVGSPRA